MFRSKAKHNALANILRGPCFRRNLNFMKYRGVWHFVLQHPLGVMEQAGLSVTVHIVDLALIDLEVQVFA